MQNASLRLYYELEGSADAPCLVLSNSLGTHLGMWLPQIPALLKAFRVLRYDARGHGKSDVPPGPYSMAQLGEDVIALMDDLGIERAHFCGLSMGGMIGIWLGAHQAQRLDRLMLCNTAAYIGPAETWNARIDQVNREGMAAIVPAVIDRWFTPAFRAGAPREVGIVRDMLLQMSPAGYTACCAAVRDMDQRGELAGITVPVMVVAGTHDQSTPAAEGRLLAKRIPGARYVELEAAHLSNWEAAEAFTASLVGFLQQGKSNG
jgi:3-oxoadipate enol-lactonase